MLATSPSGMKFGLASVPLAERGSGIGRRFIPSRSLRRDSGRRTRMSNLRSPSNMRAGLASTDSGGHGVLNVGNVQTDSERPSGGRCSR